MKKVGNILLLVATILAFISAAGTLIASILMFIFSGPAMTGAIIEGINNGTIHTDMTGTPEQIAVKVQSVFLITGIILIIVFALEVACAVVTIISRKKDKEGLYIADIVLGVFSGSLFAIIGAVFCFADDTKPASKENPVE